MNPLTKKTTALHGGSKSCTAVQPTTVSFATTVSQRMFRTTAVSISRRPKKFNYWPADVFVEPKECLLIEVSNSRSDEEFPEGSYMMDEQRYIAATAYYCVHFPVGAGKQFLGLKDLKEVSSTAPISFCVSIGYFTCPPPFVFVIIGELLFQHQ